jgi:hypothetical protein
LNITSAKPFAVKAPTLRFASSVQKYLMSVTLPQFLESNRPTNAAALADAICRSAFSPLAGIREVYEQFKVDCRKPEGQLTGGLSKWGEMLTDTLAAHINDAAGKHGRA